MLRYYMDVDRDGYGRNENSKLSAIPLADAQVRRDLALVFRKDKALSRAALAFIDIAVKHKSAQELVPTPTR